MLYLLIMRMTGFSFTACTYGFLKSTYLVVTSSLYQKLKPKLTKPSSGITPVESCLGFLLIAPRGFGNPEDVRQFKSASFSLFYSEM